AVDEAHCSFQWGRDFWARYRSVVKSLTVLNHIYDPVALIATANESVISDIQNFLYNNEDSTIITSFKRENLHVHLIKGRDSSNILITFLKNVKMNQVLFILQPVNKQINYIIF